MSNFYQYLGGALAKPLLLDKGKPVIQTGTTVLEDSIKDIIMTPIGSRLFLPEYGSRMHELQFEQNDKILANVARQFIKEAITSWERRVKFSNTSVVIEEATMYITVSVIILASNEVKSFVFPYYSKIVY